MGNSESKYVLIYTTTRDILADPFGFGNRIDGSKEELRRAATYLGEGFLLFYSVIKALSSFSGEEVASSTIPFADEMLALALVAMTIVSGLITHPFVRWIAGGKGSLLATMTCFLYWSGFCLFVIPPIFVIFLTGTDWVTSGGALSENIKFFVVLFLGVPFMFVYYLSTICNWLGSTHETEPIAVGMALIAAYLIPSAIVSLIYFAGKSLLSLVTS